MSRCVLAPLPVRGKPPTSAPARHRGRSVPALRQSPAPLPASGSGGADRSLRLSHLRAGARGPDCGSGRRPDRRIRTPGQPQSALLTPRLPSLEALAAFTAQINLKAAKVPTRSHSDGCPLEARPPPPRITVWRLLATCRWAAREGKMSSELIDIVKVDVALARTEIGTTRERAHAEPRDRRDRLHGEFDISRMSAVPRAARRLVSLPWRQPCQSCQSCHGAVAGGWCRCYVRLRCANCRSRSGMNHSGGDSVSSTALSLAPRVTTRRASIHCASWPCLNGRVDEPASVGSRPICECPGVQSMTQSGNWNPKESCRHRASGTQTMSPFNSTETEYVNPGAEDEHDGNTHRHSHGQARDRGGQDTYFGKASGIFALHYRHRHWYCRCGHCCYQVSRLTAGISRTAARCRWSNGCDMVQPTLVGYWVASPQPA